MDDVRDLKALQIDALREVANIGAGHAATALSQMTNRRIMISVPEINIARLEEVPELLGSAQEVVCAVLMHMLGDLTGRANQAVMLTRSDPQPHQVAAAHAYFEKDPVGPPELYTKIDATSAAVAAVHWFASAMMITRRDSEGDPSDAPPTCWPMPTGDLSDDLGLQAIRGMALGESPRDIVIAMVRDGVSARALLEELLTGIHQAWVLYGENHTSVPIRQINETFLGRMTRMAVEGRDRIL